MADDIAIFIANELGTALLPDNAQYKNRMEIKSESSDRLYIVSQRKTDNSWCCSCMGWKSRRKCKHLDSMTQLLSAAEKKIAITNQN